MWAEFRLRRRAWLDRRCGCGCGIGWSREGALYGLATILGVVGVATILCWVTWRHVVPSTWSEAKYATVVLLLFCIDRMVELRYPDPERYPHTLVYLVAIDVVIDLTLLMWTCALDQWSIWPWIYPLYKLIRGHQLVPLTLNSYASLAPSTHSIGPLRFMARAFALYGLAGRAFRLQWCLELDDSHADVTAPLRTLVCGDVLVAARAGCLVQHDLDDGEPLCMDATRSVDDSSALLLDAETATGRVEHVYVDDERRLMCMFRTSADSHEKAHLRVHVGARDSWCHYLGTLQWHHYPHMLYAWPRQAMSPLIVCGLWLPDALCRLAVLHQYGYVHVVSLLSTAPVHAIVRADHDVETHSFQLGRCYVFWRRGQLDSRLLVLRGRDPATRWCRRLPGAANFAFECCQGPLTPAPLDREPVRSESVLHQPAKRLVYGGSRCWIVELDPLDRVCVHEAVSTRDLRRPTLSSSSSSSRTHSSPLECEDDQMPADVCGSADARQDVVDGFIRASDVNMYVRGGVGSSGRRAAIHKSARHRSCLDESVAASSRDTDGSDEKRDVGHTGNAHNTGTRHLLRQQNIRACVRNFRGVILGDRRRIALLVAACIRDPDAQASRDLSDIAHIIVSYCVR